MTRQVWGFDKKKSPSPLYTPEERKTGRDESERATEIKPLIQQHRAKHRKAERNHHKARETLYPMTPKQSTENR